MALTKIKCTEGFELGAYEAMPAGDAKGAVVVIQEIFGVNSHIRSVVDDYAAEGFYAIAPAIFDRLEHDVQLDYSEASMTKGIELAFQQLDMTQTLSDLQATIGPRVAPWQSRRRRILLRWTAHLAIKLSTGQRISCLCLLRWWHSR